MSEQDSIPPVGYRTLDGCFVQTVDTQIYVKVF